MQIRFHKYQGTGNDFIIIDNREALFASLSPEIVKFLCDRRFGIGADGLMLLNLNQDFDFEMVYFNSDGNEGSMCGNGGRCLVKFAHEMGIRRSIYHFVASDGPHEAEMEHDGTVSLRMKDINKIEENRGDFILDTGSPHYVRLVSNVGEMDVFQKGRDIRYSDAFAKNGINVNFVSFKEDDEIMVRTYERGVENETLSCGTGVTAAAIVCYHNENGFNEVTVHTRGGKLSVEYDRIDDNNYSNIWLCGPALKVFEGIVEIDD
jgi:diaminopimelate epimerase